MAPFATLNVPPALARFAVKVDKFNVPDVAVRSPVTLTFTPSVVVPPLMVRLLNIVNLVAGSVLSAANPTVPVPWVQTELLPPTVMAPLTLRRPPAVMVIVPTWLPVAPKVRLPQIRVEPLVKVMVPSWFWAAGFPTDTLPDTVSFG